MKYLSRTNLKNLAYGVIGTIIFLFVFYKLNHYALPYLEKLSDNLQEYHNKQQASHSIEGAHNASAGHDPG